MDEIKELMNIAEVLSAITQSLLRQQSFTNKKVHLLTVAEAADMVEGLSEYHIRKMIKSGQLPCVREGRKLFINRDLLIRYLYEDEDG